LEDGHPEKAGVVVELGELVAEVRGRLERKAKGEGEVVEGMGGWSVSGSRA